MDIDITHIFQDLIFQIIFLLQVNVTADIHKEEDVVDNNKNVQDVQVQLSIRFVILEHFLYTVIIFRTTMNIFIIIRMQEKEVKI